MCCEKERELIFTFTLLLFKKVQISVRFFVVPNVHHILPETECCCLGSFLTRLGGACSSYSVSRGNSGSRALGTERPKLLLKLGTNGFDGNLYL